MGSHEFTIVNYNTNCMKLYKLVRSFFFNYRVVGGCGSSTMYIGKKLSIKIWGCKVKVYRSRNKTQLYRVGHEKVARIRSIA